MLCSDLEQFLQYFLCRICLWTMEWSTEWFFGGCFICGRKINKSQLSGVTAWVVNVCSAFRFKSQIKIIISIYRVSLKKRSLRDWHPKKWFQGQPVKMCRCKSFLLVVSKAVSCSCPLGRTKISKSFRNSILTWYMLYLYEWRPKMQKKWFLGKSMPHYHNSKSQITSREYFTVFGMGMSNWLLWKPPKEKNYTGTF